MQERSEAKTCYISYMGYVLQEGSWTNPVNGSGCTFQ